MILVFVCYLIVSAFVFSVVGSNPFLSLGFV